jgi:hypothetical protein
MEDGMNCCSDRIDCITITIHRDLLMATMIHQNHCMAFSFVNYQRLAIIWDLMCCKLHDGTAIMMEAVKKGGD